MIKKRDTSQSGQKRPHFKDNTYSKQATVELRPQLVRKLKSETINTQLITEKLVVIVIQRRTTMMIILVMN